MYIRIVSILLIVLAALPAAAAELPPGGSFFDDDGSVHEGYIEAIAALGVTRGCNPPANDRYCPEDPVTRGQMAAFLHRALDPILVPGPAVGFIDDDTSEFEADIEWLASVGVTKGCNPPGNDRFCPDDPVTREQMAAFLVRAFGYTDASGGGFEDVVTDSVFLTDINRLATAGITKGCNPPDNTRFCPTRSVTRAEMATFLGRALGLTPTVPPVRPKLAAELVVSGLDRPVYVASPPGDERIFVVEKAGRIRIVEKGSLVPGPFLDLTGQVSTGGEQGLLGLAFHPDYATNGRFFVDLTDTAGDTRIIEYRVSGDPNLARPSSASLVLKVDQPASNHNGGMIEFGPNGYLYVALGDGGGGGDPQENAQNRDTLLGSLLRLDVDRGDAFPSDAFRNYAIPVGNPYAGGGGAPEIWAIGLRNPWRFSFDGGSLYIGDVGQGAWEEIDVAPKGAGGLNYGWDMLEGTHCYEPSGGCDGSGTTLPVLEYSHAEGCSVTGGYVYRGSDLPWLDGHYFYGDYCSGWVRSFQYAGGAVTNETDWTADLGTLGNISSFGVDTQGELHIVTFDGNIYRLVEATP